MQSTDGAREARRMHHLPRERRQRKSVRRFGRALGVRLAVALVTVTAAGACTAPGATPPADTVTDRAATLPLPEVARRADYLLLGELHDNAHHHRMRLRWLDELADVHRYALALEQLDADRQAMLDQALADDVLEAGRSPATDLASRARRIASAAGFDFNGWSWAFYGPVIELALRRDLPLVAANLSNADTAKVAQGVVEPAPPPPGWGDDEAERMREAIREGHCNLLPERAVEAMAVAQRTRDARIARALVDAHERTGLPVVLLAGNGHLRRDVGVPLHLAALRPNARVVSIALLEPRELARQAQVSSGRSPFDVVVPTASQPRKDPCAALRDHMQRRAR